MMIVKCCVCGTETPAVKTSGDLIEPPTDWRCISIQIDVLRNDDGRKTEHTSEEQHLCPKCGERFCEAQVLNFAILGMITAKANEP